MQTSVFWTDEQEEKVINRRKITKISRSRRKVKNNWFKKN